MDRQDWKQRHSYHKISRGPAAPVPARRRFTLFLLPLFAIIFFFFTRGYTNVNTSAHSSSTGANFIGEQVQTVIDNFADNRFGQETMDQAELLVSEIEKTDTDVGATATASFLRLLVAGQGGDEVTDEMLSEVALYLGEMAKNGVPQDVLDRYRQALHNRATPTQ